MKRIFILRCNFIFLKKFIKNIKIIKLIMLKIRIHNLKIFDKVLSMLNLITMDSINGEFKRI